MAGSSTQRGARARVSDIHDLAMSMPHVSERTGSQDNPVYQVAGKSFVIFRNPRPDAVNEHGQRLTDVIVFWVSSEEDKLSLIQDEMSPFFTTPHFDGHPSVLMRAADVRRLTRGELAEIVQDAWLARASPTRARQWLAEHQD